MIEEFYNLLNLLKMFFDSVWENQFVYFGYFNPLMLVIICFVGSSLIIFLIRWWVRNV